MSTVRRPLAGCVVNCSVSESEDSSDRGFPAWQVNRVILQIVSALFGQGAGVVFGHDWREDGVMEAIHGFAQQVQSPVPLSAEEVDATTQPLLSNLVPWPDKARLSSGDLERLASTLRVESVGLPHELEPYSGDAQSEGPSSPLFRYLRGRGLTHLRHQLNARSHARFCLGGRTSGAAGRYPGVIEEAFLALRDKLPLYIAGFLGGAAFQIIESIQSAQIAPSFCSATEVSALYSAPPVAERDPATLTDRQVDRAEVWSAFHEAGVSALVETNGLSVEENKQLFSTPALDTAGQLVLIGLSRLRSGGRI